MAGIIINAKRWLYSSIIFLPEYIPE